MLNVYLPAQAFSAAQLCLVCVCGVLKVILALNLDQEHGKTLPRLQCSAQVALPALNSVRSAWKPTQVATTTGNGRAQLPEWQRKDFT